ncbi:MAG: class I SAM-dependent methyltransferase [Fermentimonas sp.]|nr:class I SAM-dependent methyltransferase [Fermentimonas sp.]MDD4008896.1 class I SAM-dependent methyltransferase [Fermentimonas sp.]MDD4696309.1 class I SAM-dependent methyltransferase [Fermentimonas sp.]
MKKITKPSFILLLTVMFYLPANIMAQYPEAENELDRKVLAFLKGQSGQWRDMNVPASDGIILYDLILKGNYKRAVEIGTSTGHSGIWIAWALSKTGGKLITFEIDKDRYEEALANFKKAGVEEYIDAHLGNAHQLVPELKGSYDFVFSDADKDWYKNYFIDMAPKLVKNGCFVAHNTNMRSGVMREFVEYIQNHKDFTTTLDKNSRSGISISYKK